MASTVDLPAIQFDITSQPGPRAYYLVWRSRPSRPWHSEEHLNRIDAHNKYFSLIQQGYEAYLEPRSRVTLSA